MSSLICLSDNCNDVVGLSLADVHTLFEGSDKAWSLSCRMIDNAKSCCVPAHSTDHSFELLKGWCPKCSDLSGLVQDFALVNTFSFGWPA